MKVALVGYYKFGNYGDELFFDAFKAYLDGFELVILHDDSGKYPRNLADHIASLDAVIVGGGDLVIPFALSPLYWDKRLLSKPAFIYGIGVPTWGGYNEKVVLHMRDFFQNPNVKMIVARDEASKKWIEKHLQPRTPVEWYPDPVLALPRVSVAKKHKTLGIITREQAHNEEHQAPVREFVKHAVEGGFEIRQLILGTGATQRADVKEAIEDLSYSRNIVLRNSIQQVTMALLECSHVISMKFHGCVVACMHGVPTLALSPADKFKEFYSYADLKAFQTTILDQALTQKFQSLLDTEKVELPRWIRESAKEGLRGLRKSIENSIP